MEAYAFNPSLWKVKTERQAIQGCPQLHSEFEVILGYMRAYLTNK